MTVDEDFDIPATGAIFTFGKSRFAENSPSKFWIKNDIICKVSCGDEHTAIVTGSGRVFTIGNNGNGQLGLGHRKSVPRPSCVKALKPQRVVQITCGRAHTVVATEIGSVFAWGHNGDGQLGTGNYEDKDLPVEVLKLPTAPLQLAAGSSHSLLLTDKGEVLVWGSNKEGQLGCEEDYKLTPTKLVLGNKIESIACGYYHSLAITDNGQLISWGEVEHGKLGLAKEFLIYQRHPQLVNIDEKVIMAVAGSSHSLILTESGNILSCGMGSSGQLGQGGMVLEQQTLKRITAVENLRFVYISAGDNHSAAISDDGLVYTWGCGRHGKLCLGEQNLSSQFSPVLVSRLRHLTAVQVECGGCHTMVLGYRRSEIGRISAGNVLIKEAKDPTKKMANNLRDLVSKQTVCKEMVLPTVPSGELKEEEIGQESHSLDSTLPLQDNYLGVGEVNGDQDEHEFFEAMEESQKKASRFTKFWNTFLKRETPTTSYESKEVPNPKEQETSLVDLENNIEESRAKVNEYEEEEEEEEGEEREEDEQDGEEPHKKQGGKAESGTPNTVRSRTCVLF